MLGPCALPGGSPRPPQPDGPRPEGGTPPWGHPHGPPAPMGNPWPHGDPPHRGDPLTVPPPLRSRCPLMAPGGSRRAPGPGTSRRVAAPAREPVPAVTVTDYRRSIIGDRLPAIDYRQSIAARAQAPRLHRCPRCSPPLRPALGAPLPSPGQPATARCAGARLSPPCRPMAAAAAAPPSRRLEGVGARLRGLAARGGRKWLGAGGGVRR